jgi:hypothetical protein
VDRFVGQQQKARFVQEMSLMDMEAKMDHPTLLSWEGSRTRNADGRRNNYRLATQWQSQGRKKVEQG